MKLLDRLSYSGEKSSVTVGGETIEVKGNQIICWCRIRKLLFPAIIDTGHTHNLTISEEQIREWAGVSDLEKIGHARLNKNRVPLFRSDFWIRKNGPRTNEPTQASTKLEADGIAVVPPSIAPRIPLIGLRMITRNELTLIINGAKKQVTLKKGWF